jgi:hypothetical protein
MKLHRASRRPPADPGFALVVTLSLLTLLTLVGVAMLGLSAVSLRSASSNEAFASARSNARLALALALGELQATTGRDQTITAPATIVDPTLPQSLTGVWQSWKPGEETTRSRQARDDRFVRWLASSEDPTAPHSLNQAPALPSPANFSATLLSGIAESDIAPSQAPLILPSVATPSGRLAYASIDEGIKTRIDLHPPDGPEKPSSSVTRAGAPPTDRISAIPGWESFDSADPDTRKLVSLSTASLQGTPRQTVENAHPDLTTHSASVLSNPVDGGLKQDFSLYASRGRIPASERSLRLYQSAGLLADAPPADPFVNLLANYHQTYQRIGARQGILRPGPFELAAIIPSGHNPYREAGNSITVNRASPQEAVLAPTLVRVDVIFSMITRRAHGGWANRYGPNRYLLHLQYLPIITLHNPYNIPLVFEGMKVTFNNLPVGFNFVVDGQPLSSSLVALNQMFVGHSAGDTASKNFGVTLRPSLSGNTPFLLEPGQTKIFGTPRVPPTWRWIDESPGAGADGINLFDWRNDKTSDFIMTPTLLTTSNASAAGFDVDWINPQSLHTSKGMEVSGGGVGMVALNGNEQLAVQFAPYAPPAGRGSFTVTIDTLRSGNPVRTGVFNIKYGTQARLNELLAEGTSPRYQLPRRFPATYPRPRLDPPITPASIFEENNTALRDYVRPKPFMLFSLAHKTTIESFLPSSLADSNPAAQIIDLDFSNPSLHPPGAAPLEMVMMPITPQTPAIEEIRATQEAYFFSGNSALNGTPRATFFEIPPAPLQSIAQFRHANLGSSGFFPFSAYTVGESVANPLIGTESFRVQSFDNSALLDHAFLANEALWDRWFLSTAVDQRGPLFPSARNTATVLNDFIAGREPLLNPRFKPYPAPASSHPLIPEADAFRQLAAHLMLEGGFNINSTSVNAWRAVLSSLAGSEIAIHEGNASPPSNASPFPRSRRPVESDIDSDPLPTRRKRWQGYRSLTESQIEELATFLVEEIRNRGPFLSLADFVNREPGPSSPASLRGPVQAAIDRSSANAVMRSEGRELDLGTVGSAAYGYRAPEAAIGNTASHAPGWITQGDILSVIGSRITPRSDTFRIRAYGEARNAEGRVTARAWCEALVQRVPDFIDTADSPSTAPSDLNPVNQRFGRRYQVVSFRWLNEADV